MVRYSQRVSSGNRFNSNDFGKLQLLNECFTCTSMIIMCGEFHYQQLFKLNSLLNYVPRLLREVCRKSACECKANLGHIDIFLPEPSTFANLHYFCGQLLCTLLYLTRTSFVPGRSGSFLPFGFDWILGRVGDSRQVHFRVQGLGFRVYDLGFRV